MSHSVHLRCARLVAGSLLVLAGACDSPSARGADVFRDRIVPFVKTYCAECHNETLAEAQLNLSKYESAEAAADDFRQWEHVVTFVQREEMPPATAAKQPTANERKEFLSTLREVFSAEAKRLAGDPGPVLPRRLTNAEYDHSIRDLTGVDIRPTSTFPADPAAGEGFSNTGEALAMSPSLFNKLYGAAQQVADHAVMTTQGVVFAPYSTIAFEDRKQFFEQAILKFYESHTINYERALTACWEYRHRPEAQRGATIESFAREREMSPKYLAALYALLQGDPKADAYYVGWLRQRWNAVPAPKDLANPAVTAEVQGVVRQMADEIQRLSKVLCPKETDAIVPHAGNAPIAHLERRRKTAAERNTFNAQSLTPARRLHFEFRNLDKQETVRVLLTSRFVRDEDKGESGLITLKSLNFSSANPNDYRPGDDKRNLSLIKLLPVKGAKDLEESQAAVRPEGVPATLDVLWLKPGESLELEVPAALLGKKEMYFYVDAELDRAHSKLGLASVSVADARLEERRDFQAATSPPVDVSTLLINPEHPAARDIAASGAAFCHLFPNRFYFADETRGLSAGFHLIEGFFRDDQPLCDLVLSEDEKREIDRLWKELEFVTDIADRMIHGFVFFERSERNFLKHPDFDSFKEEDPKLVEPETLARFEQVYLARSNVKKPVEELKDHPIHIFFEQVRSGLKGRMEGLKRAEPIYLRNLEEFAHKAYRRPLTASEVDGLRKFYREVAAQPEFGIEQAVRASLVRILMSPHFTCRIDPAPQGETVQPLPDLALASRLSYFLWSSTPDAELLAAAESGRLKDEHVLLEQTRRMLKDARVRDFAGEFFGQWLGYRDFPQQEQVDRTTFKEFDDTLRQSMFEEPTRLAAHLIQHDRPVTELLDSNLTFIDQRLARHYGLPFAGKNDEWQSVEGLKKNGRGGILGMAVFLTKNSQPQRTSPVKRGFWVVHKILGEHIPAPPADVVALPAKETDTNGKTVRQLLAMHVDDMKCARCHVRFDAVGLSMEGFDSIGRRRTKDLAGRPVDDTVKLPDGSDARGVPEYAMHLVRARHDDFIRTFCRKLLGYALGRSLQLSDEVLLEEMHSTLEKNDDRLMPLFETVVRSPQFRNQRCAEFSAEKYRALSQ
ncbi:MAG: DUF1592 domain-containing protein [Planctomycetaceae bacterium]|nr:DUF1592 domain-containing protein [Planctomycetaceae bacterium]